jgi:adenylate cyclase
MMLVALEELNKEIEAEGLPKLGIGIGVNTGPCVIGNVGGDKRLTIQLSVIR